MIPFAKGHGLGNDYIVLSEADRLRLSVPLCGVITEVVKSVKFERGWPTPEVSGA